MLSLASKLLAARAADATLESTTLETLSQEVTIGLMGASLMNPR